MDFMQIIEKILKKQNIKQDNKVEELYLGKNKLEHVHSLKRFRFLQRVWLNSNKLRTLFSPESNLPFLHNNYRITELYLQNNDICDITGALSHLPCLRILMLQKNQLPDLYGTLPEIQSLLALQILNLFDNPIAQEHGYRTLVIHSLPQVLILDRQEVTASERRNSRAVHEPEREAILTSIGFGRRTLINSSLLHTLCKPPKQYYPPSSARNIVKEVFLSKEMRKQKKTAKEKVGRSVMQYTTFDWSRVLNSEQRRLNEPVPAPQNLTVKIR